MRNNEPILNRCEASLLIKDYKDSFQLLVNLIFDDAPVCAIDAQFYRCLHINDMLYIANVIDVVDWVKNSNDCEDMRKEYFSVQHFSND